MDFKMKRLGAKWKEPNDKDDLFDKFFKDFFSPSYSKFPPTDIVESAKEYILSLQIPGFKKDDIKIELTDSNILITGEYKFFDKKIKENYILSEIKKSDFKRAFIIPHDADVSKIDAIVEDGILTIKIGRKTKEEKVKTKIDVK